MSGTLTDEDGGIRDRNWQWYRGGAVDVAATTLTGLTAATDTCSTTNPAGATDPCIIENANSSTYTTTGADGTFFVHLVVTYTDAFDSTSAEGTDTTTHVARPTRAVQAVPAVNAAPKFGIQDRELDGDDDAPEGVTRMVKEGNKPVADFMADDTDLLTFKLGGADYGMFKLVGPSMEENSVSLEFKDAPDYENASDADGDNSYEVSITATDPSGASDMLMVTVMVENIDDAPTITLLTGPAPEDPTDTCGGATAGTALVADCRTLLEIMGDLVGDGTASLNWAEDTPIGDWDGVAGTGTGRVTHIHLRARGLAGEIPAGIAKLDALERLTLTDNDLTGEIPDLTGLDSIQWLVLGGNAFTGGIPASLANLDSLLRLWLHRNDGGFEGGIPAELGSLPNLRYLMLYGNGLTGGIPTELGNATNLKALYLHNNMLTGSIPASLGNLTGSKPDDTIRLLYLHNNMLSGDIPAELGNLISLDRLYLRGNMLTGCVPAAIAAAADNDRSGLMACPADDGS